MSQNLSNILVFRTNIDEKYQACRLVYVLEKIPEIQSWNLDLEDRENILRVDSLNLKVENLIQSLSKYGIRIEELPIW